MTAMGPAGKTWNVRIDIAELDGTTSARARLDTGAGTDLTATGVAHLNPSDPDVPEIGDEIATARALSHLAHVLLETAASDLADVLRARVRLDD
jgi:hypothetical protein